MSDLISRSELIDYFYYGIDDKPIIDGISDRKIIDIIKKQPTAYSVAKVVEKLEELKTRYFLTIANTGDEKSDFAYENVGNALDKAIEIVKQGGVSDVYGGVSVIKSCEYEDINKADCINCFNGLPTNECKYYEEIERKKLRQMVHERAERDRKKEYSKALDDFVNFANAMPLVEEEDGTIRPMLLEEMAEQLKAGGIE
ncbi:MAG: hypothetical protein ACI4F8_05215 [Lachnospiraceae bacterium]